MLVTESRPRDLRWFHAGPLLYGDWGTSRLYVLGLAFLYTAHASVLYLAAIGLLMIAVSWAYTIVCREFPDGGGVYTAARQISPTLSVVGSTLLLSGYIMTAAISVVEAFHYFGVGESLILPLGIGTILLIGAVNWLGAKSAGRFALIIAFAALGVSAVMAVLAMPAFLRGIRTISFDYFTQTPAFDAWVSFTKICLALAGVEAVANMTGMMNRPVEKTAKRTIWPVTLEVVGLNMIFGLALAGLGFVVAGVSLQEMHQPDELRLIESRGALIERLPEDLAARLSSDRPFTLTDEQVATLPEADAEAYAGLIEHEEQVEKYTNAAMKVVATEAGKEWFGADAGFIFGKVAGITFGLLLLSATNTAVMAMVSVLFAMGQDRELPRALTKLNYSGVPSIGLLVALVIPIAVIAAERDVTVLAKLYVLGVCGAITVTLVSSGMNRQLKIGRRSRAGLWALGGFLAAVTLTIAVTQLESLAFSGGLVVAVLGTRGVLKRLAKGRPEPLPTPEAGWLAELAEAPTKIDPSRPKIMLAARGRYQSEFAVDLARRRKATLFAIYVRTLRVMDMGAAHVPSVAEDPAAQEALGTTALLARDAGVPFVPIYVTATEIADEILDYTVTFGCDTLIMGKTRRSAFARKLEGDVVAQVAADLPDGVALISRSADQPHIPRAGQLPRDDDAGS
ncbi:MAG: universal stress protein [Phycisphaerales bacterium JB037]